ncbi:LysM peptidoglycan-binding domain-containing protein [Chryseolinea sp. H1M3-3]|uniref:LysM peptidoglycan-binding domain-containing protein n=1 Tax=Chryseolinea sp. H1M3-3 TaxID=3034144 RepID=UPI0023EE14FF|nr:LysM peptidoglycan-binding domain-containing protein [Chryseolinea sp. H1M3-3]
MINEIIFSSVLFFNAQQVHRDSIGTETVNGKVFVIHSVGEKETLYAISRRYGASIESILQYNPTADAGLEIGQILKIPYTPRKKVQGGNGTTHTVAAKETMYSISKMYGVTIDEIKQWNNITDNALSVGQQLVIRKSGSTPVSTTTPSSTATTSSTVPSPATTNKKGVHTVAPKETMFSISRQYGVSVQQLKDWNKLEGNELSIGQELIVSAPQEGSRQTTPVAKTTSPAQTSPVQNTPTTQQAPPVVTPTPSATEAKKETPVQTASTKPEVKEQTIRISESVKSSDEVLQTGLAELIEGTDGNRKYLALHRNAPVGTIMKVRNEMNNREVFVRVMGKLPDTAVNDKLVIKISKSAYDRLGAIDSRFRVEVTYYK